MLTDAGFESECAIGEVIPAFKPAAVRTVPESATPELARIDCMPLSFGGATVFISMSGPRGPSDNSTESSSIGESVDAPLYGSCDKTITGAWAVCSFAANGRECIATTGSDIGPEGNDEQINVVASAAFDDRSDSTCHGAIAMLGAVCSLSANASLGMDFRRVAGCPWPSSSSFRWLRCRPAVSSSVWGASGEVPLKSSSEAKLPFWLPANNETRSLLPATRPFTTCATLTFTWPLASQQSAPSSPCSSCYRRVRLLPYLLFCRINFREHVPLCNYF